MVSQSSGAATPERASEVLSFWFGEAEDGIVRPRGAWFQKDEEFDAEISTRFSADHELAAAGELDDWLGTPYGALALVILLDQFPRNLFRGSPRAFETDARARSTARAALDLGHDARVQPVERWFFYLPFEHSEDLEDQRLSLRLFDSLGDDEQSRTVYGYAVRHEEIIDRFGRFPHRNETLGRESTAEEKEFLEQPGSSF
ncbi:DUF924 family protein [Rubrobacter aplysinae]|uniref:DUF924 family protein n=1 Tax=Rubrobacter aplysinae TaxID=909625 RepID=UPI00064B9B58|nr:DUF924 family protein [Rubrobacter aplysinae]